MGFFHIFHFHRILDGLWKQGQILLIANNGSLADVLKQEVVDFFFVQHHFGSLADSFYFLINLLIRM